MGRSIDMLSITFIRWAVGKIIEGFFLAFGFVLFIAVFKLLEKLV